MRVNQQIRAREVRVVDSEGNQLGVMPLRDAVMRAQEVSLDLVEVAPTARPPVCRIMNYGKFKYEQSKRDREARKKQKVINVKEIRMSPQIDDHDFQVKAKNADKFLKEGDKVKVTVRFRGREIVHSERASQILQNLATQVDPIATMERPPKIEGRNMIMVLAPRQS